jgi:signal transduction histidine kinase
MVQSESAVDLYVLIFGGALALSLLVAGVVGFVILYQKRVSEQELVVKKMELTMQQEVVYRTLDAVEDERKRVAHDLHDEIGAALSAMRLLVGQLAQATPPTATTTGLATKLKVVIDDTIDSIRRISNDLLPQGLDELGLIYALEGLCENAMGLTEVDVDLTVDTEPVLPTRNSLIIYRLVQELLNNAVKHAEATEIHLSLQHEAGQLRLHYTDNGKGFDFRQAYQHRSFGLKNIETRARMLHGKVTFETQPDKGLEVTVLIPLA